MNGFYSDVVALLKKKNFHLLRSGKGSHEVWTNGEITVTVPFNCYSKYTANSIMKEAGINKKF